MEMKPLEKTSNSSKWRFLITYGVCAVFGITMYILVLVWNSHFRGGFSWTSDVMLMMNWHPVLLILGLSVFYSQSILVFRLGRNFSKKTLKIIHMSLNLIAFILSVIGLKAAFNMRTATGEPHLYSLHSWIGFLTVLFFAGQFTYAFVVYLWPGVPLWIRAASMPIHRACGKAIFLMGLVAIATGLMTKVSMVLPNYSELSAEAYVINFIALFLMVFSGIALYLVNAPEYQRVPLPSD